MAQVQVKSRVFGVQRQSFLGFCRVWKLISTTVTGRRRAVLLPPVWVFWAVGVGSAPRPLFHSSVELWSHHSSANVDPAVTCQSILLRLAHSELFNTNGQSLFPLCSTRHLMCHFDWQWNGGPICKCRLPERSAWKDIHQKLGALFLVSVSYYLYSAVSGALEGFSFLKGPAGADHMTGKEYGWAIKVHFFLNFFFCLRCDIRFGQLVQLYFAFDQHSPFIQSVTQSRVFWTRPQPLFRGFVWTWSDSRKQKDHFYFLWFELRSCPPPK